MCNVTNPQVNVGVWTKMVMKFLERELLACSSVLQLVSVSYQFGETFNVFWVKTKPHIVNIVHELIPYNQYSNTMRSGFRMAFFLNLQESN